MKEMSILRKNIYRLSQRKGYDITSSYLKRISFLKLMSIAFLLIFSQSKAEKDCVGNVIHKGDRVIFTIGNEIKYSITGTVVSMQPSIFPSRNKVNIGNFAVNTKKNCDMKPVKHLSVYSRNCVLL